MDFKQYKRLGLAEARPVTKIEAETGCLDSEISVSRAEVDNGSPKAGDMIARNPLNHNDQWLIPEKYFNENFGEIVHDFGWAIEQIKAGKKVAREGWNGKGMWIAYSPGHPNLKEEDVWTENVQSVARENGGEVCISPYILMRTADKKIQTGWLASQSDMLSEDWVIVE